MLFVLVLVQCMLCSFAFAPYHTFSPNTACKCCAVRAVHAMRMYRTVFPRKHVSLTEYWCGCVYVSTAERLFSSGPPLSRHISGHGQG
jgi:hypothetical protein